MEMIDYSKECQQTGVKDTPYQMDRRTLDSEYDVVIYTDGSAQIPERGFGVEDQRAETGFSVVVMTSSLVTQEIRIVEIRKRIMGGRAINFDVEMTAIREAIRWLK